MRMIATTRRPKIVLFSPSLDAVSGVTTHVQMLFGSDLSRDHELLHFQVGSEGLAENALQKSIRFAFSPLHLAALLLRTGAEVIHTNTSLNHKAYWRDLAYFCVAKMLGRHVVNQIHGGALPQNFFLGNALLTWILRRFLLASDVVVVLSSQELAAYRAFDERINVHLVPNAIDPVGLADQARSYNMDRPLRLAYVGRLVRAKGLFEAIEALAKLNRGGRDFVFAVAGGGADQAELVAAVEKAGLAGRVRFCGSVFGAEKCRLWLDSDVFVFPTHDEGLPYSLLEAMAAGCVPVTTPVAAIPDVMQDGRHGFFVEPRNPAAIAAAIARLDDDRALLVRMAAAARQRVIDHYGIKRLEQDFRRVYASLRASC